ncbi:hypothetical protein [uncultured Umboniibacter sp.]|uniref:hypothetical protein n=1 Tax=uncultured Umboniibacter sp. TaxID=1798917 RepID=UPI0026026EB1|nr:hypothetical protein [uncultured Umboniibacter sp.]
MANSDRENCYRDYYYKQLINEDKPQIGASALVENCGGSMTTAQQAIKTFQVEIRSIVRRTQELGDDLYRDALPGFISMVERIDKLTSARDTERLEDADQKISDLQKEVAESKHRLVELKLKIEMLEKDVRDRDHRIAGRDARIRSLIVAKDDATTKCRELNDRVSELESANEKLKLDGAKLEAQKEAIASQLNQAAESNELLRRNSDKAKDAMSNERAGLQGELAERLSEIQKLTEQCADHEAVVEQLTQATRRTDALLDSNNSLKAQLNDQMEATRRVEEAKDAVIEGLRSSLSIAEDERKAMLDAQDNDRQNEKDLEKLRAENDRLWRLLGERLEK